MNTNTLKKIIAMYVIAVGINGAPNGHVYAKMSSEPVDGMDVTLRLHTTLIDAFIEEGMMTESDHYLRLTEKGRKMFEEIVEIVLKTQ